ncbi:hypothetical protein [Paenibacillus sp. NFR01]|uniref:hypothetical protein n=1 Tax=Paenibacillus sp. NFR01 TaxID=1566279 RepID=UPI0008C95747|nr:hypothetical protein [Paenibacillus sp. NFR01]SET36958.1 hypothetical protein SAMN03159358_1481 [Paenibacillus sp. NFR01]
MKRKIRKQLVRKYIIILFLFLLSLGYLYFGDWLFGYGLSNIGYIANYLLYTPAEKLVALIMLLCLVVPDIITWVTGRQPRRAAEK